MRLKYFDTDITDSLHKLASDNHIIVENVYDLSAETPDFSIVRRQGVFMNKNFDTNVSLNFRLAHELSHLIYGNKDIQKIYTFSEFGHRHEELLAHRNAIRMLMSIEMPTTVNGFMEYYHVPSWLEHYANETFKSLSVVE
ncbi:ImmA/IrrE family metallo-endopeptidase [Leuconostoc lactis]|uniref:ImmA/IrrE family metallo-endopeptidase n=1 Tax=Leuconostoc lactis TaxID=1246 RepID=UPI0009FE6F79|nr:ImmA/IrrE family metallo-endopeptidase [Leuconostoc lactis]ORI85667.1 ImmA/IrrE family metallo-endopeptidase [Leuconostoc lactis]ORI87930.1 ImmA/IrrE family metallo-endopeptidase [Leuconostoc lactis]